MTTPKTMQAVAIDSYGGKELLILRELPIPEMSPTEVLIKVEAAGVGVWDAIVRQGFMKDVAPAAFPLVLGGDGAGTVVAIGTEVRDFRVGDKVYGYAFLSPKGGFYAEKVVLPSEQVALVPKGLPMQQAGVLAVPGLTALQGLDDALKLKPGNRLLIFGVGSVGHLAVQLAKRLDVRVLAAASGDDSVALARAAGADEVVNNKNGDLASSIRRFAPNGLDGVLATVNGEGLGPAIAAIRHGGRLAYPNGVQPEPKSGPGVEAVNYSGTPDRQTFDRLNALIEAGPFAVHVAQSFPLSEAAEAHAAMDEHHLGRMVLLTTH
jgi:NADPH2:quinone reductase